MRREPPPSVIALAGPNGAGKSTVGPDLLRGALRVTEFVNADVIAQGLSAFNPDAVAITAGRAMRARLRELAGRRADFAFETTLAGRTHATWIQSLLRAGYEFDLVNAVATGPRLLAAGRRAGGVSVRDRTIWERIAEEWAR